ncbi:MAG: GGDEF domain-containing protein, partial [Aquificota bacterium]
RIGGDEFGLIIKKVSQKENILKEIEKIKGTVKNPFIIENQKIYIFINIGISFYPKDGKTKEELIAAAEAALKESKKIGSNTFEIYNPLMKKENFEFLTLENELRNAVKNEEFRLFFQPIVELRTGKIVGAEALLRWFSPKRGLVSPLTFIPILEETSLIHEVGNFVFYEAAKYAKKWEKSGIYISVNISPSQVVLGNLLETAIKSTEFFSLDPSRLVIELTETVLMENLNKSKEEIERLNRYGIKMFIDDFGTGYSSLSYLKNLPFYAVKIDRSFIKDIPEDEDDIKISKAIINLAHSLDKKVVAEGIETKEQFEYMKALDCDFGQGYLFSKPVSPEEFDKLLRSKTVG